MHHTAVITLMFVMFAQFLILTFGAFVLWWMGDFGDRPKSVDDSRATDQVGNTTNVMRQASSKPSNKDGEELIALAHDHPIQPQVPEDRIDQADDVERSRDCEDLAEKALSR